MAAPGFGDVVRMIELANQIYTYGFTQSHNAPILYKEFGENISHLALNLGDLWKVIEFIRKDGIPPALNSAYFDSLCDIIGNYRQTLQDCDKLLKDNARFRLKEGFIHNIIWNVTIASEVQGLKDRLSYLNIKLLTMLNTLDLGMAQQLRIRMNRIHLDLASRIDAARDDIIQHITALGLGTQGGFTGHPDAMASTSAAQARPFDIPASLEILFKKQIQGVTNDSNEFPLVLGLDAVVYHINETNKIPADSKENKRERQWMEVAKAFWILIQVKSGQEYDLACSVLPLSNLEKQMNRMGITIASYVRGLEGELANIAKASNLNNFTPDSEMIMDLFHKNSEIWLHTKEEIAPTPSWELEFSEKIMSAPLKGPYRGFNQSLHLFRLTDIDLKLVISDVRITNENSGERNNNSINVDLERSRFIPLYATTTSSASALNVNFQGDSLAAGSTGLSFKKRSDLFRLQQAVTGYRVMFQALNIKIMLYISGIFNGSKREYAGRLQLWRAKRLKNSIDGTSSSPASSESPSSIAASPIPSTDGSNNTRQFSGASVSEEIIPDRRDSAITMASNFSLDRRTSSATTSSVFSTVTAGLKSSPSTFKTSIVDKDGNIGIMLDKPELSMLVFYLEQSKQSSGPKHLSFLAIQLDEEVIIEPSACECRKSDTTCLRSVIQRSDSKPLLAYRLDAASDLDAWNLAKLGQWQRGSLPSNGERMKWIAVDFDTFADKDGFKNRFGQLKKILVWQKSSYITDLKNLR